MDFNFNLIPALFLVTFVIAIGFGVMQFVKARKARREHHQSASARAQGETPGSHSTR